jgi:fumarate reductase flavoprotein subunit
MIILRRIDYMKKLEADIVVVGGGLSGLTAATQAAEKGANVIVFEKGSTLGGAANMGMAMFAVESKYQRDQMDTYTKDEAFNFFMEYTHWKADAKLVRRWFNMSAGTIEWLENFGVEFLGAYKYFQDSRCTQHMVKMPGATKPVERQASRMVKLMTDYANELGVQFMFNTPVKKILTGDKNQVLGVMAVDESGEEVECLADAVIVGSGGIGNNVKMIKEFLGYEWGKDMFTFRIPGLDGDGINMVWDIGGQRMPISMEVTYNTPGTTDVFKTLSEVMRQPSCIMVSPQGERMINEQIMNNTTFTGNSILQQTGHRAYTIMGSDGINYLKEHGLDYITYHHGVKDMTNWEKEKQMYFAHETGDVTSSVFGADNGVSYQSEDESQQQNFYELNSLEEVAEVIGCDYETLKATIDEYNSYAGGYDAKFIKPAKYLRPITGDKFYVARHFPSGYGSLGGVKVDYKMECLDTQDKPIPGLYGCGTDTANVFAGEYCFYHPGSTMSYALNSARIAGMEAWDYINSDDFVE